MTASWTVGRSSRGFQAPLKSYGLSVLAEIAKASGRKQDLAIARWEELKTFVNESGKIRTGMTGLPLLLHPVTNLAGTVIAGHYVLTVGGLRGYYQVEELNRYCLAKLFRADVDRAVEDIAILLLPED